ncbi:lipase [Russula aff. rugulosa BPL654]|nr:lipase [Russula aff. rugulosa BPL654]
MLLWSAIFATLVGLASAVVLPRDSGFYTLTQDQIVSTDTYANYAAAVKCGPQNLTNWECGHHCEANPYFKLYEAGGDGAKVQFWMVGFDTAMNSVIVAHEGTEKTKFFADLTDLNILKTKLDPSIFPYIPIDIEVHKGFAEEHAKTAALVLQAVQSLLRMHPGAMVTVIGHSLGGALALLDGLRLRLVLAPTTVVRVITYGMPRVGDQAFASFVDDILPNLVKRINNKHDPIPIVPAMSIGFRHVSGEIHIQETGQWTVCPYEDNQDPRCIVGAVPSIFQATFSDHSGPYNHIMLKCDI